MLAGHPKEHIQENLKFYRAAVNLGWTDHENLAEVITTQTAQSTNKPLLSVAVFCDNRICTWTFVNKRASAQVGC